MKTYIQGRVITGTLEAVGYWIATAELFDPTDDMLKPDPEKWAMIAVLMDKEVYVGKRIDLDELELRRN